MVDWNRVTDAHVKRALGEYDRLGPDKFLAKHGFSRTLTYDLVWEKRLYPPKAILGTAYEEALAFSETTVERNYLLARLRELPTPSEGLI